MKILIAAETYEPYCSPSVFLAENLIRLLNERGHKTAVCGARESGFRNTALYAVPAARRLLHSGRHPAASIEEKLSQEHVLSLSYLRQDLQILNHAIYDFRPDLILEMNHPCAVIAARFHQIPFYAFTDASIYKDEPVPYRILKDFNTLERENHQEQILHLSDLDAWASKRIAFGIPRTQPFPDQADISLYGNAAIPSLSYAEKRRVVILFTERPSSSRHFKSIIHEAFSGASYDVKVWYPGCRVEKDGNIQIMSEPRPYLIKGSDVCIHDGSPYLFNQCLVSGTRQLVIESDSFDSRWNADFVRDLGCGIILPLKKLTMESLYEKYRQVCSSDLYQNNAVRIADEINQLPSLLNLVYDIEKTAGA